MDKEEMMNKISEMENELVKLKEELNSQEKPSRRWKPKFGEKYWFIDKDGDIYCMPWNDSIVDNNRYELGNCFKTEEEAKFAVEQLKVLAELREYANDDKEWNNSNKYWFIEYSTNRGHIEVDYHCDIKHILFDIYFSSEEQARKAVAAIGEERLKKYYFCVEG